MKEKKLFDKIRMPIESDKYINICIFILATFGLIMVTSASMGIAVGNNAYLVKTVIKQVVFSIGGYIAMIFMARFYTFYIAKKYVGTILISTGIVLLFTLVFKGAGGAKAWIRIPMPFVEVTIQPSEFSKIAIICAISSYIGDLTNRLRKDIDLIKAPLAFSLGYVFIVMFLQRDFGSGVVMLMIAGCCFLIPKHKQLRKYQTFLLSLVFIGILFTILILSPIGEKIVGVLPLQDYQKNRILSSINPFIDRYNSGYQLINGLVSFASGGFFGVGFGNSVRKYTNFPAANTDFILAIVVEELGYLGFLVIFICYMTIIIRLFKYAFMMKSEKGQIILIGTATYILIHFLFNVGGVTGLIPLTGVPLLMISAGGSSTLSLMMAIGISQSIITKYNKGEIG